MGASSKKSAVDDIYDLISGDEDGRVCKDIPDEACEVVPRNFFLHLGSRISTKIGDVLGNPGLVLAWLLSSLAAPAYLVGFLVPVREAGSLLPQMIFGGAIRRIAIRKWFWVAGSALQGATVLVMAATAFTLEGAAAGWTVLAALALFSLARGVCSVATKDLVGKTVPRTRRGRLSGLASTAAGIAGAVVGLWLLGIGRDQVSPSTLGAILCVAGALWLVAAVHMAALAEKPGATGGGGNALREAIRSVKLLAEDAMFRRFCLARGLLASTVLSMPFYVVLSQRATGGHSMALGLLLVATSVATSVSASVWGWLADRSSRLTMGVAGLFSSAVGISAFAVSSPGLSPGASLWLYGGLFFLIGLGHTGIRLGRKTYLVDFAPADRRPSYVAVANTLIGVVLLASSGLGALGALVGERGVILLFALLGAAGGLVALGLEETG